jgi:hypothetical protein
VFVQVADLTAYGEERGTNRVGSHLGKQSLQQWIGQAEHHVRGREEEVYSMAHRGHNLGEGRDVVADRSMNLNDIWPHVVRKLGVCHDDSLLAEMRNGTDRCASPARP